MAESNNSNSLNRFNLEATAHERSQVNQVGEIKAHTVNFGKTVYTGKPFQAPPLPTYYVDRPEYSQDLKTHLLASSSDVRTLVVTAIHGLGSVGKSTLAMALAHDKEVQAHFCDGILWATLGQQPNLLSLLSGWVQALGDYNFKATSVEATSNHLRTLLYDKAVLLVVDDTWNTQDAQAFNIGGARCQVLVTTREGAIAKILGAGTYSLDVMQPEQAMELLTKKLGRDLTGTEINEAKALAKVLGYLPLALELAAAQVADSIPWTVLLQDMQQEVARLKTLDDNSARDAIDEASLKRLSLIASLNLSIQQLSNETRENFIWLGILPEDVNITHKMTATLWEIDDERDAALELRYLHSKALLLSGVPLLDGTPTYRFHDLFHDLARNLLTAPPKQSLKDSLPGLGITLPTGHAIFLEKYRNLTDKNLWHTLPSDGYIHQHLVWHLEKAGEVEEIHKLLREQSEMGGNGWYEVRERLGQVAGYLNDVVRAWELAEANWDEASLPKIIGLQCRYALIIASINTLATIIPEKLFFALINNNVWTPEEGLFYALRIPEPNQKVRRLIALTNYLPFGLKEKALEELKATGYSVNSEQKSNHSNSHYISLYNELSRYLELTGNKGKFACILRNLNNKHSLSERLTFLKKIKNAEFRAIMLLLYTIRDKILEDGIPKSDSDIEVSRIELFKNLIPDIQEIQYKEILPDIKDIQNIEIYALTLTALADKLPEITNVAFKYAKNIQNNRCRILLLDILADKLPSELLLEARDSIRYIQDEESCVQALGALAGQQPQLLFEDLEATAGIGNEEPSSPAAVALANKQQQFLLEALKAQTNVRNKEFRAKILVALPDKLSSKLLPEFLEVAKNIWDEEFRAKILVALEEKIPSELLPEFLEVVRNIRNEEWSDKVFVPESYIEPCIVTEALRVLRNIGDKELRIKVLTDFVCNQPQFVPEALESTRKIGDKELRAKVLTDLVYKQPQDLPEALQIIRNIVDKELCSELDEKVSLNEVFCSWKEKLHHLSQETRPNLLKDIKLQTSTIFKLGGKATISEAFHAVKDVTCWWR